MIFVYTVTFCKSISPNFSVMQTACNHLIIRRLKKCFLCISHGPHERPQKAQINRRKRCKKYSGSHARNISLSAEYVEGGGIYMLVSYIKLYKNTKHYNAKLVMGGATVLMWLGDFRS